MMTIYKQMLPELGGYLTKGAQVDLGRVEKFIRKIGSFEDTIFQKRMRLLSRYRGGGVYVLDGCVCWVGGWFGCDGFSWWLVVSQEGPELRKRGHKDLWAGKYGADSR